MHRRRLVLPQVHRGVRVLTLPTHVVLLRLVRLARRAVMRLLRVCTTVLIGGRVRVLRVVIVYSAVLSLLPLMTASVG